MATKNSGNLRNFDWDDTALINAYNEGLKEREMLKKGKKTTANKENVRNQKGWKVGDNCRAMYLEDSKYYEAEILGVHGDNLHVKFIGYGDEQVTGAEYLRPSAGKKARRRQRAEARNGESGIEYVSESGVTTTDCEESQSLSSYNKQKERPPPPQATYNYATVDSSYCAPLPPPTAHMAVPAAPTHNHACCAPPPVSHNMNTPFLPAPPAPPIPQIPSLANNPSLSAMLVSWYMAGYYTGLHQSQKDSQCSQRCCGHGNRCCH